MIGRAEIETLIPHAGAMCLWDDVLAHNESSIHCRTRSHQETENPLRRDGQLSAVHLIEYGAQTMAIHGGLQTRAAGGTPRAGVLVAVRDAKLSVESIDTLTAPLECVSKRLVNNPDGAMYEYRLTCGEQLLATARVSVIYLPT